MAISKPKAEAVAAQTVLAAITKKSRAMINRVSTLQIKTADDYATAALLISNLKEFAKLAEADRAKIVDPIKKSLKEIDAHFKPFLDQVKAIEADTKAKMIAFIESNERAAKKLMEQFEKGEIKKLETVVNKQSELTNLDNSSASVRKLKEVEIVDAKKIPAKYMMPDLASIKADLLAGKSVVGCKLTLKTSIAI